VIEEIELIKCIVVNADKCLRYDNKFNVYNDIIITLNHINRDKTPFLDKYIETVLLLLNIDHYRLYKEYLFNTIVTLYRALNSMLHIFFLFKTLFIYSYHMK